METEWGSKLFSIMKWVWAPQRKNCVFVIGKLSFFKIMQDIKTFLEKTTDKWSWEYKCYKSIIIKIVVNDTESTSIEDVHMLNV